MNVITAIALLQAARRAVDLGQEDFICWALDIALAVVEGPDLYPTFTQLKIYIRDQLDGYDFLQNWVDSQSYRGDFWLNHCGAHRLCRLAWIDRMIFELETKGRLP